MEDFSGQDSRAKSGILVNDIVNVSCWQLQSAPVQVQDEVIKYSYVGCQDFTSDTNVRYNVT